MEDARFDAGQAEAEEPVVQHLFEDLEVAQERGGRKCVSVGVRPVGIGLQARPPDRAEADGWDRRTRG